MNFRTICTTIGSPAEKDTLTAAMDCARLWQAHLDVICTATRTFEPEAMMPDYGIPGVIETLTLDAEQDAQTALDQTEAMVRAALAVEGFSWSCQRVEGDTVSVARSVVDACRFADLAVLAHANRTDVENQTLFAAMLSGSRVPVLLIPPSRAPRFSRVVVAWDDSPQSLAAVRAALPLLERANEVSLLMIAPAEASPAGFAPAGAVAEMLSRHNVRAEITLHTRDRTPIADVLKGFAAEKRADLIVMGAYGHSKMRERLLGGVTLSMLRDPAVPLFLAH